MSKVEQQSPSATAVTQRKTRKPSRGDELAGWAEDLDEQLATLHAAVLEVEGELPPGLDVEMPMAIVHRQIRVALQRHSAHAARGALVSAPKTAEGIARAKARRKETTRRRTPSELQREIEQVGMHLQWAMPGRQRFRAARVDLAIHRGIRHQAGSRGQGASTARAGEVRAERRRVHAGAISHTAGDGRHGEREG